MLAFHCIFNVVAICMTTHACNKLIKLLNMINRPKLIAKVVSKFRSAETIAWSITHCIKNGLTRENTSRTKARIRICPKDFHKPLISPNNLKIRILVLSFFSSKLESGHNSKAMPVKCDEA